MMLRPGEIAAFLEGEIETIAMSCASRIRPKNHLEQSDDDYEFIDETLDRWGDRRVPKH